MKSMPLARLLLILDLNRCAALALILIEQETSSAVILPAACSRDGEGPQLP